jgi:hypothetical protein
MSYRRAGPRLELGVGGVAPLKPPVCAGESLLQEGFLRLDGKMRLDTPLGDRADDPRIRRPCETPC